MRSLLVSCGLKRLVALRLFVVLPGLLLLHLSSMALAAPPARAAGELNRELAEMAKKIKLLLDQKGVDAIAVGDFTAPTKLVASAGPAIAMGLTGELETLGVSVRPKAELQVNGRYQDVDDRDSSRLGVRIKAHVVDRSGDELLALEPRAIFNVTTIAALTGLTVAMPAEGTESERDDALAEALDQPEVNLADNRIAAAADSPYAIEIQVKNPGEPGTPEPTQGQAQAGAGYRPRPASKSADGLAFVEIRRDECYAIKLINDSPHDAAVTVTIDGLSVFAFSANPGYTHYIVPSKQSLVVPGWHRTNEQSDAFLVTEYAKSAVAELLPQSATVGTITATFAAAWSQGSPPPDDEAPASKGERRSDATGIGPPVDFKLVEVAREVGRLRSSVSVRYNRPAETDQPEK